MNNFKQIQSISKWNPNSFSKLKLVIIPQKVPIIEGEIREKEWGSQ